MNQSDKHSVSGELGLENVARGDVARETTRTLDFDPILKNADLHICCNAVVAVEDCIRNDFMSEPLDVRVSQVRNRASREHLRAVDLETLHTRVVYVAAPAREGGEFTIRLDEIAD